MKLQLFFHIGSFIFFCHFKCLLISHYWRLAEKNSLRSRTVPERCDRRDELIAPLREESRRFAVFRIFFRLITRNRRNMTRRGRRRDLPFKSRKAKEKRREIQADPIKRQRPPAMLRRSSSPFWDPRGPLRERAASSIERYNHERYNHD